MQRRMNIQSSSLINLLSILTILSQFLVYYFFDLIFIIWGISILISIVCCYILLEQTLTFEACFQYSLLVVFISLVILVISYFGKVQTFLPYTGTMLGIASINWLIPHIFCFFVSILDHSTRFDNFRNFYRNSSIIFCFFYLGTLIYGAFISDAFPAAYPITTESYNFTPFSIITLEIEGYLYNEISLGEVLLYLFSRIVVFLPYGFYISLLLRRQSRLPKYLALLIFPFLIEALQLVFIPSRCDIDDLFYALLGGLLGSLLLWLTNMLYHALSGKEFLGRDNEYHFYNNNLNY